jgi:hypothetical protein
VIFTSGEKKNGKITSARQRAGIHRTISRCVSTPESSRTFSKQAIASGSHLCRFKQSPRFVHAVTSRGSMSSARSYLRTAFLKRPIRSTGTARQQALPCNGIAFKGAINEFDRLSVPPDTGRYCHVPVLFLCSENHIIPGWLSFLQSLFSFPTNNNNDVTIAYLHPVRSPYCRFYSLCRVHTVRSSDKSGHNNGRDSIYDTICRISETGKA